MNIINPWFEIRTNVENPERILARIAEAGRTAYLSESKKPARDFVQKIVARGHESVLEHESISALVICDRGVTHEVVRHRLASYTQESTRYCNYAKGKFGSEITFIDLSGGMERDPVVSKLPVETQMEIYDEWLQACMDAETHYMRMISLGATPQIARSVLNNSTKTSIVMTANLREWRHFFKIRCAEDAHPQMREITCMMLAEFKRALPVVFDDIG